MGIYPINLKRQACVELVVNHPDLKNIAKARESEGGQWALEPLPQLVDSYHKLASRVATQLVWKKGLSS